jgi:hypothetical protein
MDIVKALDVLDATADCAARELARHARREVTSRDLHRARTETREAVAVIVAHLLPDGVRLESRPLVAPHNQ